MSNTIVGGKGNKRKKSIILLTAILLIAVIVAVGVMSGRLYISIKDPGQKLVVLNNVCDDQIITRYNNLPEDNYTESLGALASDIEKMLNHTDDPDCLIVLYDYNVQMLDNQKAKDYGQMLLNMSDRNIYPSSKNSVLISPDAIRESLDMIQKGIPLDSSMG